MNVSEDGASFERLMSGADVAETQKDVPEEKEKTYIHQVGHVGRFAQKPLEYFYRKWETAARR